MIRVTYFIVCLLLGITLVSCIRDEALNAEADILTSFLRPAGPNVTLRLRNFIR